MGLAAKWIFEIKSFLECHLSQDSILPPPHSSPPPLPPAAKSTFGPDIPRPLPPEHGCSGPCVVSTCHSALDPGRGAGGLRSPPLGSHHVQLDVCWGPWKLASNKGRAPRFQPPAVWEGDSAQANGSENPCFPESSLGDPFTCRR